MKTLSPAEIKEIEVVVGRVGAPELVAPVENETQRHLRAILDFWGQSGELHVTHIREEGTRRCVLGQLGFVMNVSIWADADCMSGPALDALNSAAIGLGFPETGHNCPCVDCNNDGFPNARKMVLRAIELAGTQAA